MFEKDAEEIANKSLCTKMMCYNHCNFNSPKHHRCGEWHREYECALKGAEFGYNKANEWHYVKDGDLPKENKKFYVYSEEWGVEVKKFIVDTNCFECRNNIIIAWKEIVLPKE